MTFGTHLLPDPLFDPYKRKGRYEPCPHFLQTLIPDFDPCNFNREFYSVKYRSETPEVNLADVIEELPPALARELSAHLYDKFWKLKSMNFWRFLMFHQIDEKGQLTLCKLLSANPMGFRAGSKIFEQDGCFLGIYVIVHGHVRLQRRSSVAIIHDLQITPSGAEGNEAGEKTAAVAAPATKDEYLYTYDFGHGDCFGEMETVSELMCTMSSNAKRAHSPSQHKVSPVSLPRYGEALVTSLRGAEVLCLTNGGDKPSLSKLLGYHPEVLRRFEGLARSREHKICELMNQDLNEWVKLCFTNLCDSQMSSSCEEAGELIPLNRGSGQNNGSDDGIAISCREFEESMRTLTYEIYDRNLAKFLCDSFHEFRSAADDNNEDDDSKTHVRLDSVATSIQIRFIPTHVLGFVCSRTSRGAPFLCTLTHALLSSSLPAMLCPGEVSHALVPT